MPENFNNQPSSTEEDVEQKNREKEEVDRIVEEIIESNDYSLRKFDGINVSLYPQIFLKLIKAGQSWDLSGNLDEFPGLVLDKEFALKLIEAGDGEFIIQNLDEFQGLVLDREFALKLIETRNGDSVFKNLDKFPGLVLDREFALKLIEIGKGWDLDRNLNKFQGLVLDREFALKLIETRQAQYIDLNKFQGLIFDREFALKLIEVGVGDEVAKSIDKFPGLNHREIALKLLEIGRGWGLNIYLSGFQGLDKEVALKLIESGQGELIIKNPDKFQGLDREIALKFQGLDREKILKLIEVESDVVQRLDKFEVLDREFAFKLIEAGKVNIVAKYLNKFQGLDKEIALKLIEVGQGGKVAENLDKFQGLDKEIACEFTTYGSYGWGKYVAENLDKFQGLNCREFAMMRPWFVVENIDKFPGLILDKEIALKLIDSDPESEFLIKNIDKFPGLILDKEIALKLIRNNQFKIFIRYFDKFKDLDINVAFILLETLESHLVMENLDKFPGLVLAKDFALKIIERQRCDVCRNAVNFIMKYFNKFSGLDREVALKLVEVRQADFVMKYFDKFLGLNRKEIVLKLIETGQCGVWEQFIYKFQDFLDRDIAIKLIEKQAGYEVMKNLSKFSGLVLDKEFALKLLESNSNVLAQNIDKFQDLDRDTAIKFIEKSNGHLVMGNLDKFPGLVLDKEIALKLLEMGQVELVAKFLNKFQGLGREIFFEIIKEKKVDSLVGNLDKFPGLVLDKEIALKLLEIWEAHFIIRYINEFQGLDREVALKMIEVRNVAGVFDHIDKFSDLVLDKEITLKIIKAGDITYVVNNFEKFQDLDREVALKLIEARKGSVVVMNLQKFQCLDHKEVALKLIETGQGECFAENIDKFKDLDREVAFKLIEVRNGWIVIDNLNSFKDSDREELEKYFQEAGDLGLEGEEYYVFYTNETKKEALDSCKNEEEKYQYIYQQLVETKGWADEQNIIKPFESGAQVFGYQKMFEYLNREDLTRHDGLHNFQAILKMFAESGLKPQEFFNNILAQVVNDDSNYGDLNNAHIKLNTIASNINLSFAETMERAKNYTNIKRLQELLTDLDSPGKVFESWKNLKKFEELNQLLQKTYILDELQGLNKEGKEKLYNYIETLAFHPNISMEAVLEFWRDPSSFFGIGDEHTTEEVQDRKKPSNYTNIPNLDLTAEELRDALVEGSYDHLQVFKPLEITYRIPKELKKQISVVDLKDLFLKMVGSRKDNKKGEAKDPKKAFNEISKLFKKYKLNIQEFLSAADYQEYLRVSLKSDQLEEFTESFSQLIYDQNFGLVQTKQEVEADEYRAKINLKSDPDGVVAGNDTACCMPFGSGKNNVYTFNPICSLFTIQKKNSDGVWRTIAQSVLTRDKEIDKNISALVSEMQQSDVKMQDLVGEESVLVQQPSVITCDNVEVAQNFKGNPRREEIIKYIYLNFFKEYLTKFAKEDHLDEDRVIIGEGYSDSLTSLPRVDNHFVPEAPVGYSDNLYPTSLLLSIKEAEKNLGVKRSVNFDAIKKIKRPPTEEPTLPRGLSSLTFTDSLSVAYIEGKAYADNQSLMEYLHNMENALIAKDVNNEAKGRPNLSLKYQDSKGKMRGYLLAYEGCIDEYNNEYYEDEDDENNVVRKGGEKVIYVSDLASDGSMKSGGLLMKGFIELYKKHYIDKNNFLPIYAFFREKTSYQIMKRNLAEFSKLLGYELEIEELGTEEKGDDTMHEVIIRPKVE